MAIQQAYGPRGIALVATMQEELQNNIAANLEVVFDAGNQRFTILNSSEVDRKLIRSVLRELPAEEWCPVLIGQVDPHGNKLIWCPILVAKVDRQGNELIEFEMPLSLLKF